MMRTIARARRNAFTFIELMFVIVVIALLIALFLGAVAKVLQLQVRTECATEITKMQQSLEAARHQYGDADSLPSRLILYSNINVYRTAPTGTLEYRTAQVFRQMFGKRFISNGPTILTPGWGVADGTVLEGSQVLVFYLGGMTFYPNGPTADGRSVGFSKDPLNPTLPGGERIGPFYEFRSHRLRPKGAPYPSYIDPFTNSDDPRAMAYVFFGALSPNNYATTDGWPTPTSAVVRPYYEIDPNPANPRKWLNPNTYQIISAGKDRLFGAGGPWNARYGYGTGDGADDLSNFSQTELGNGQE